MRLLHTADWHLGRIFYGQYLTDDQAHVLENQFFTILKDEKIIDHRYYHTIKEVKNGEGPAPIKTDKGWLHLAHGVRACAAGLRYVLYLYMTSLEDPSELIAAPGGYARRQMRSRNVLWTAANLARGPSSARSRSACSAA